MNIKNLYSARPQFWIMNFCRNLALDGGKTNRRKTTDSSLARSREPAHPNVEQVLFVEQVRLIVRQGCSKRWSRVNWRVSGDLTRPEIKAHAGLRRTLQSALFPLRGILATSDQLNGSSKLETEILFRDVRSILTNLD